MRDHGKGGALTEVTFYILLSLFQPRHGYALIQYIQDKTQGRLVLGAGTLYGALKSLEEKGWICLHSQCDGRKKEYVITPCGKEVANREMNRLVQLLNNAEAIIGRES